MHRIGNILIHRLDLPLIETFETARRSANTSPTVIIELHADDVVGYGEATPVKYVTGEDAESVVAAVEAARDALIGLHVQDWRDNAAGLAADVVGSSARTGLEMAMLDAHCKSLGIPLYSYLGGTACEVRTDITVPITSPERAREIAAARNGEGFTQFKAKVGKDEDEDIARVLAIRDGAPGCSFVLDANQGFEPEQAVRFIRSIFDLGIVVDVLEQPVAADDLDGLRYVTEHAGVPVYADEAAHTPEDVRRIIENNAASGVNVKLMKAGIAGALEIVDMCRRSGLGLMFGCMLESKVAQSASVHIACATRAFDVLDLDSDLLIADQPVRGGVERCGPVLKLSDRSGLGCEVIDGAL